MGDEIIKVLNQISDKFGIAIDWGKDNVMPYLQDLMHRVQITEIAGILYTILLPLVIGIIALILCKYSCKKGDWDKEDGDTFCWVAIISGLVGLVAIVMFVLFLVTDGKSLIDAIYIPEKIFLEQLKGLI